MNSGTENAAAREPSEIYFDTPTTIAKTTKPNNISTVTIDTKIPNPVAIPLPPLKPAKIVQICPSIAANPAII